MENFKETAKRFVEYHEQTIKYNSQISAITEALIGAIGLGHKVNTIEYDKDAIQSVDLSKNIEIFKQCGSTVSDLESLLLKVYEKNILALKYWDIEKKSLITHYNLCPKSFLTEYVSIPVDVLMEVEKTKNIPNLITDFRMKSLNDGKYYSLIVDNNILKIFFKEQHDLSYIKNYFLDKNRFIKYELHRFNVNNDDKYLGYIYNN